jgi:hypothetical protein
MYKERIAKLQQAFDELNNQIAKAEKDENFNKDSLNTMHSQRSMLYSDLRKYTRLQWEEDHERVNFEDDR